FGLFFVRHDFFLRRVAPCRHPSIRTLDERLFRSVPVGCSRFSRCCHLIIDLGSISKIEVGPGVSRSHRNSALELCLSCRRMVFGLPAGQEGCCWATVRTPPRSPTSGGAEPPACAPPQ